MRGASHRSPIVGINTRAAMCSDDHIGQLIEDSLRLRADEKNDCALYLICLDKAARTGNAGLDRGGVSHLHCGSCTQYAQKKPESRLAEFALRQQDCWWERW